MKRYFAKNFIKIIAIFLFSFLNIAVSSKNSFAILSEPKTTKREKQNTIIKADRVEGDREKNIVNAYGNVEATNGLAKATSDKASYDKENGTITATGNVKITDLEVGNLYTEQASFQDDFTNGSFEDGTIIFNDGSYLQSQKITKQDENITILTKPLFSICASQKILDDNKKAGNSFDAISLKSSKTTIDRKEKVIRSKHGIVRIYNFPIFYTPYISLPLKENKRKSGFLTPSYLNNSQFGLGIKTPYFIAAAPNIDLTVTPTIYTGNNQLVLKNEIHQLVKYGEHTSTLELANNKITDDIDREVIERTDKNYRYKFISDGNYVFNHNSSLTHNIFTVGDRDYLRDYEFNFRPFTTSEINYDYTKGRDYLTVNSVRFQELESSSNDPAGSQFVLPSISHYIESKKSFFAKEKYGLSTNFTHINRQSGLQYRRLSLTPEIRIPINIQGNLIDINTKFQWDYYSLEENNRFLEENQDFDNSQTNYKPEFSVMWRLPLIQKLKSNTLMLEPIASFVSSSVKKNQDDVPNEDSNDSELTINNLFVTDRIAGYDRNETGERVNYGIRSSMFNRLGQFELSIGQSYRISQEEQDVTIRGFNENNKSNIVGQFSYIIPKYFKAIYLFQLNDTNYDNEVNSLLTSLTLKRLTLTNNYLLIKEGVINTEKREQTTLTAKFRATPKLTLSAQVRKNLVTGKNLQRSASVEYGGCCVIFKFTTTENNTNNLLKTQRSHSINLVIRGL